MKKFDKLVMALALIASVILLALWFVLGFNHVDAPLDLVISIIWWLVMIGAVWGIARSENRRRERLRTVFVAEGVAFNPAAGTLERPEGVEGAIAAAQSVLEGLRYGFSLKKLPEEAERPRFTHVIRTFVYEDEGERWTGEVLSANDPDAEPRPFEGRLELAAALSR